MLCASGLEVLLATQVLQFPRFVLGGIGIFRLVQPRKGRHVTEVLMITIVPVAFLITCCEKNLRSVTWSRTH